MALLRRMASPVIMKDLLGLIFLSLLLMEGTSLECETCRVQAPTCSGERENCLPSQDACITWVTEHTAGNVATITTTKACSTWSVCGSLRKGGLWLVRRVQDDY